MKKIIFISHPLPPVKTGQALKGAFARRDSPLGGRGKKIILLLAGFCVLFSAAAGQEIEWQSNIGGIYIENLRSVQQTLDGGYIVGGYSTSNISGDKTENCIGGYDYWIVKTDASGTVQWENTIGGSGSDQLNSIQQTSDGGYILGGYSGSNISGDKTEDCIGGIYFDYWIVKTDASGTIQWQNTIGGNGGEYLTSIQQTTDRGYIIGGSSNSGFSNGGFDYWIVKTDSLGIIQWQNAIGGSNADHLYGIQQTSDGGYILSGHSNSGITGDKTESNWNNSSDYWVVKVDSLGTIQWQNTIGGNGSDGLPVIQQTADGGYIIGGYSISNISGDKTENSIGEEDYWILKIDSSGAIQWQNTIGGSNFDYLFSIRQTTDGGYILGGYSSSTISGDKTENWVGVANYSDYWIVKTDASGIIQWQNTIGGNDNDYFSSIQLTTDGGYILGGYSYSDISGDKTENGIGGQDYWIVKLTNKYNYITGKLFIDLNSNAMQDAGEPGVIHKTITEINTGRFCFSQQDGSYKLVVLDSGNFDVHPALLNYYASVPATYNIYLPGIQQTDSLNDFAFQPTGVFNDLCITITPLGNFRANMNANYMINYENIGATTLNGTVIFFPDDDVTFVSSNVTPTLVTTDSVVWNMGTLTPFQTGSILVTVHVNAGTSIGTIINSSVIIEPVAGDANTVCNYNAHEVLVTGSFDPNAILVDRATVLTTELASPPYLNYIIYFQNTGNDTAFNARILNPIDTFKLDIHSFEFVASSHPVNINYNIWERNMEFTFDTILLPDSNVNEPGSHGFVRYRIKPLSTLVAGDSIKNTAYIYFDFNQPVMTNTAVTEIVLPTNLTPNPSPKERGVTLAPNPASNLLAVTFTPPLRGRAGLYIYNLFGREIYHSTISNHLPKESYGQSTINIDLSGFTNGIYFIEITAAEKSYRTKFVKE